MCVCVRMCVCEILRRFFGQVTVPDSMAYPRFGRWLGSAPSQPTTGTLPRLRAEERSLFREAFALGTTAEESVCGNGILSMEIL